MGQRSTTTATDSTSAHHAAGPYPASWHPDPSGRHDLRWFNGSQWTADVADDGRRGFDPLPSSVPSGAQQPGRAAALTSLTLGVTAAAIAWMPFVVVLGIAAAMSAIVLGIVAVSRSRQGRQAGQGLAVAGIACGVGALLLSGVGMASSRELLDDLRTNRDPGAYEVSLQSCDVDADGRARASGRITNRSDGARSYAVTVTFGDGVREFADRTARISALAAQQSEGFEVTTSAGGTADDALTCRVERVSAPTLSAP